jgi:Ribonuclease G/E
MIAVSVKGTTARIALLRGDFLAEFFLWNWEQPDGVWVVYTARLTARAPAMAGSFADIGNGVTGFLPDSAGKFSEGTYFTAQITRAPQGGKGPRLAALPDAPGDKPGLVKRGPGPLLELAARFPNVPVVADDYAFIAMLRPVLPMTYQAVTFDPVLEDEISLLFTPIAPLPHGALAHITPTPAVITIDIDAGGASSMGQLTLNQAIIPELARQIVLRNLSGGILIDFAGMKAAARVKLTAPLQAALTADPLRPRFLGFSHLGFAEILRPRIRPPLHEFLPP